MHIGKVGGDEERYIGAAEDRDEAELLGQSGLTDEGSTVSVVVGRTYRTISTPCKAARKAGSSAQSTSTPSTKDGRSPGEEPER